jgi:hypothetical protein
LDWPWLTIQNSRSHRAGRKTALEDLLINL